MMTTVADSIMTAHNRNAAQLELDGICNLTKRCLGCATIGQSLTPILHSTSAASTELCL